MAIKRITLDEDKIKLISNLTPIETEKSVHYDINGLWGGSYLFEDMAMILGFYDEYIQGTEKDYEGKRYAPEKETYMHELYSWVISNIFYIESLVHFYASRGGLEPGTYKCIDTELYWEKEKK